MKIFVAGKSGQLARELVARGKSNNIELYAAGRAEFDIRDLNRLKILFEKNSFDIIINAAAYTNVDGAETDRQLAKEINVDGARNLALVAKTHDIPLIHISTDYVFDGTATSPYVESDNTNPINVYGMTKRDGELAVAGTTDKHLILRTSWLYSRFASNFVKTMLRIGKGNAQVHVVNDQFGNPTNATDITEALLMLCSQLTEPNSIEPSLWGIYHLSSEGICSWADLAREVFRISEMHNGPSASVAGILSCNYHARATRPLYTGLNADKMYSKFGIRLPNWKSSLYGCISQILKQ